jgi:methionine sulfoxide reductase heme-binding subunit
MSPNPSFEQPKTQKTSHHLFIWIVYLFIGALAGMTLLVLLSPQTAPLRAILNRLFQLDSVQAMWYLTRAAGLIAYLLLWLSTAWGLVVASKILDNLLHRSFTFDFHEFISLLAVGFLGLHIFVLTADKYLPYSLAQILVPFLSPYRPLWVGIGVIAMYLTLLVTVTFYMRRMIGMKAFRFIHVSSLVAYLGATIHGFLSGTDSSLPAAIFMYVGTFLVIVFLMIYWLVDLAIKRSAANTSPKPQPIRHRSSQRYSNARHLPASERVHSRPGR